MTGHCANGNYRLDSGLKTGTGGTFMIFKMRIEIFHTTLLLSVASARNKPFHCALLLMTKSTWIP